MMSEREEGNEMSASNVHLALAVAKKKKKTPSQKNRRGPWRDFLEVAVLYSVCLLFPAGLTSSIYYVRTWLRDTSLAARDTSVLSDSMWVAILSTGLTVLRIVVVHFLVPLSSPDRVEALVRVKSSTFLSSTYPLTPKSSSGSDKVLVQSSSELPPPPLLSATDAQVEEHETENQSSQAEESRLDTSSPENWLEKTKGLLQSGTRIASRSSLVALGQAEDSDADAAKASGSTQSTRVYAAPRYAIAVFRLGYSCVACACAFLWFSKAPFWPPALGGSGKTRNCWTTFGFGDQLLDNDFDLSNASLKRYFVLQTSYHLHSLVFQVLSLLLYYYSKKSTSRSGVLLSSTSRMIQHVVVVVCLAFCYFFSALRRLAAITMFTIDVTHVALHLLQLCLNAPSFWNSPSMILTVHRFIVIPVFIYTRFFILPWVVGYSALSESRLWFQQLQQTLFPAVATFVKIMFVTLLISSSAMNVVLFRRLIHHPQLAKIKVNGERERKQD